MHPHALLLMQGLTTAGIPYTLYSHPGKDNVHFTFHTTGAANQALIILDKIHDLLGEKGPLIMHNAWRDKIAGDHDELTIYHDR